MPFCVNCGREYAATDHFCNSCGSQVPQQTQISEQVREPLDNPVLDTSEPSANPSLPPILDTITPPAVVSPPYGRFTLFCLGIMCSVSTLGFVTMDDIYRGHPYLIPFSALVTIALALCVARARPLWTQIRSSSSAPEAVKRNGKLIRRLCFFLLVSTAGGIVIGAQVGESGAQTEAYVADIATYSRIGDRISQARNKAENTIEGQLEMYEQIEPDVNALEPVTKRLIDENKIYSAKYPSAHDSNASSAAAFENTEKRCDLLLQQIAVAKDIARIRSQDDQLAEYREKMLPILKKEDELDGR